MHRPHGLSYVPKKILTWMLREARRGLMAAVGNTVSPDYHVIHLILCSFLFLSARVLFSLAGYAQKHSSTYWTLWSQAEVRRTYSNLFESHCYSFMKTNLKIIRHIKTLKVLLATTIWPTTQYHYVSKVH